MTAPRQYINLNAYLRNPGYHESAWKVQEAEPAAVLDIGSLIHLARTAERGMIDSIFLPDSPGTAEFRTEYLPGMWFDPVLQLSAVATATEHVGLVATVSTTYSFPWDLARRIATLDFISHGRAGWNIVTTAEPAAAANFGVAPHPPTDERYARAEEFVEVVLAVWDGWEDDAFVGDRASGTWADPAKLHPPRHHGTYFDVSGYLPFPRSPQGHPLLAQAGSSPPGIALAGKYADAVFTPQADIPRGVAFRRRLHDEATANGRNPEHIRALPGLSFLLGSTEAEAQAKREALETAASSAFRWRNTANLAGLDFTTIDPDAPVPEELLTGTPRTSFGGVIAAMARERPMTFRELAMRISALPGGLDYTGTPEGMADLITNWFTAGACDGFTLMANILPAELELFVEHVVPILQARGIARREYLGTTLREHLGLPRPAM